MSLSLSVALCTWNGAAFLDEQLRSLAAQERPPDELVVRDDASTDDTVSRVRRFAATAPFPVRLTINPRNLGSTASYAAAIPDCGGEIIALCDQDDSWLPAKLRAMERFLLDHPGLDAVFCDAWMVGDDLRPTGERLWPKYPFNAPQKSLVRQGRIHELLAHQTMAHGMTLAFRRRLAGTVALPFPDPLPATLIHDNWITLAAAFAGGVGYLDDPLVLYRQHHHQQFGAKARRDPWVNRLRRAAGERRRLIHDARLNAESVSRILQERFPAGAERLGCFLEKSRHLRFRDDLPPARRHRLGPVLAEWWAGRYRPGCPRPWLAAAGDVLVV